MENIRASDVIIDDDVPVRNCLDCGRIMYDTDLDYCSIKCWLRSRSSKRKINKSKMDKEVNKLMEQYRRGGVGEDYHI